MHLNASELGIMGGIIAVMTAGVVGLLFLLRAFFRRGG